MIKDYRNETGPSPELRYIEEKHAPACHVTIPGTQNMCTRDAGHDGDHRCKAEDVDRRLDRDYHESHADTDIRAIVAQRDELTKALFDLQIKVDQLIYRPTVDDSRTIGRHTLELRKQAEFSRALLAKVQSN